MTNVIEIHRDGAVATVVLNRPDRMNALNLPIWRGLSDAFDALAADDTVRCVVLRGAGELAFAPGADITEFETDRATAAQAKAYDVVMRRALAAVAACPHPTIAQIYGPCVGGGLELAAQCDIRVSAASGKFGVPVGKISVCMGHPEIAAIQALVGTARALEILLEARVFGAQEALAMGLVNRVVADDALEDEVQATVKRITANAPLVNRWHKSFVRRLKDTAPLTDADLDQAYDFLTTDDYAEGMAAFAAKCRPVFEGK
ncbi:MAG TPA: enoyl-CoA hydratase-related protein [Patescibacteria group bacterium]|nr:enoyl-CoA hydratase-related protein [Patescibacteria group bacterium]